METNLLIGYFENNWHSWFETDHFLDFLLTKHFFLFFIAYFVPINFYFTI